MTRLVAFCLLIACLSSTAIAIAADGPSAKVPELKALDNYVGAWSVEITSKDLPFTKGQSTTKWILDGMFVQQTGELQAADGTDVFKVTTLMTYDAAKRVYRSWTFLSDGNTIESEGTWDAKAKILTFVGRKDAGGGFPTTTADFSTAGIQTWKIVAKDGSGKVVSEMTGTNTRKK